MTTAVPPDQAVNEASAPANVMIKCPVTGMNTYTGWFIDPGSLAIADPPRQVTHCEHCHQEHAWTLGDVIWETF